MNYETAYSVLKALLVLDKVESALWFGTIFIWAAVYYILYQIFRLRFLKVLLMSQLLSIPSWIWMHRHIFFERPEPPAHEETLSRMATIDALDFGFRFIPFCVATIGAVMALSYLQRKWKEHEDNQQLPGT